MFRVVVLAVFAAGLRAVEPTGSWSGFRGSGDSHTAATLPLRWSETEGIAWKVETPGFGQSTPVARGGRIFLTAVEGPKKDSLHVLSLDARTGKEVWRQTFASSRPQEAGERVSKAAPTPALDERALYAMFDSGDLIALGHDGKVLWKKNCNAEYVPIQNGHDFGSSLRQSRDALFLFVNHPGAPSYLVSIAKRDGATRWRVDLPAEGGWSTPVLSGDTLLVQRKGGVAAYAAETGKLLWEDLRESSREGAIPSISVSRDIVVIPSGAKGATRAVRLSKPQDTLWTAESATNGFSSPLLTAKRAYFVNVVGALFCLELETGRQLWTTRLPATTWASAIASGDRVYFFTGEGATLVFRDSDTMEKLAESKIEANGIVYAVTPLDGALLVRTGKSLWKISYGDAGSRTGTTTTGGF